jgi:hypothetical protein
MMYKRPIRLRVGLIRHSSPQFDEQNITLLDIKALFLILSLPITSHSFAFHHVTDEALTYQLESSTLAPQDYRDSTAE